MTATTGTRPPLPTVADGTAAPPEGSTDPGRSRFTRACTIALAAVGLPYLWILWDLWSGSVDPFRHTSQGNFYDLQGHAMLSGHFYVPTGSLGIEAFVNHGHQFTYFGIFPSLLRLPVLALTHSLDGRLTAPSILLAWLLTGVVSSMLLWRVRIQIRGMAVLGWAEAVCCGGLVAVVNGGSVLLYLAATPKVSHEDLAWSVALTMGALFGLLGVVERATPRRLALTAVFVLGAALNRSPTGFACIIATLLVAGWFVLSRSGEGRRRVAIPLAAIGLGALALSGLVNWAKLGMPFGLSEANQVWTHVNAHRRQYLASNGGNAFGIHYLPTTLVAYFQPLGISVSSHFPWLGLPTGPARPVGRVLLDQTYPTASITASMPLLLLLAVWGLVASFRPRPVGHLQAVRLLLVAAGAGTAGVLFFGYIADRYLADFLPFLALASMVGLIDVWRRCAGRSRRARSTVAAGIVVLGVLGIWVNIGAAITPTGLWTSAQAKSFVSTQRSLGGTAAVIPGPVLPYWAPQGSLFAAGSCRGLYLSTGFDYSTVPSQQLQHATWIPVEQAAGTTRVLTVTLSRPVSAGDAPVRLVTYGPSALELIPSGADQVRLQVVGPYGPRSAWPPTATPPVRVRPDKSQRITVTIDRTLQSISVSGLGGGIQLYLPGTGPVVAHPGSQDGGAIRVGTLPAPTPSMALCRQMLRG